MVAIDYAIHLVMTVFLIFGVYQFYFWCQRHPMVAVRTLGTPLDEAIPYRPEWAWVYSFLYYPAIVYLNWTVTSARHFNHLAMSFFVLLAGQMAFFVFFPVETPAHWRGLNGRRSRSERFLAFVRRFDSPQQLLSEHARQRGDADGAARAVAAGPVRLPLPGADRGQLRLHQAALPHRPTGGSRAGLDGVPSLPVDGVENVG
jgi:hypothetical protein